MKRFTSARKLRAGLESRCPVKTYTDGLTQTDTRTGTQTLLRARLDWERAVLTRTAWHLRRPEGCAPTHGHPAVRGCFWGACRGSPHPLAFRGAGPECLVEGVGGAAAVIPRHRKLLRRFPMISLIPRFIFYDFLPASQCVSV